MLRKLSFILLTIFYVSKLSFAQDNFLDKSYYLVDSLELKSIPSHELKILDSCLNIFHQSTNKLKKIEIIDEFIQISDETEIWNKYNNWLYKYVKNILKTSDQRSYKNKLALILSNKGVYYSFIGDFSKGLTYYKKSVSVAKETSDFDRIIYCYNKIALVYYSQGEIELTIDYLNKSLKASKKNKGNLAFVYNGLGTIYKNQGKVTLALDYLEKSLEIEEELNNKIGVAACLGNIAVIYKEQGKNSLALEYLKKSSKLYEEIGAQIKLAISYNNLGLFYKGRGKIELAKEFFLKGLKIAESREFKDGIAFSYSNLGLLYDDGENEILALKYLRKGLLIYDELGNNKSKALSYNNLARFFLKRKEYGIAKKNAESGLKLSIDIGYPSFIQRNANVLKSIAVKENDYKKAFEMYQLEIKMRDSILNEENYKATIEQYTKYQYEKKKATDSVKNAVADKIKLAKLKSVELEYEKAGLELNSQKKQKWFLYISLLLAAIFTGVIYNRFKASQKQKGVIEKQKMAVESQKQQIEKQHKELEETHNDINDSIKYSERLQKAIFPSKKDLDAYLRDHFILFEPKDIVSGDFYWLQKFKKHVYFAVGDCTGHGIPGALVSVVCSNALNRSVKEFRLTNPNDILSKTRELVIETFSQSGKDVKDGMDIVLCSYIEGESFINFSGANNPLWVIRKTKYLTEAQETERSTLLGHEFSLIEFKGTKQPVGLYENMKAFSQTKINLCKGDTLYMITDGYADQFGGEKGKKFKYRPFKKLLLKNSQLAMSLQKEELYKTFKSWKGEEEQVDDICIVGIKI